MSTPSPKPQLPSMPTTKRKLVEAAIRLILARGFTATGVDAICAEAGVTKGAFFPLLQIEGRRRRRRARGVGRVRHVDLLGRARRGGPARSAPPAFRHHGKPRRTTRRSPRLRRGHDRAGNGRRESRSAPREPSAISRLGRFRRRHSRRGETRPPTARRFRSRGGRMDAPQPLAGLDAHRQDAGRQGDDRRNLQHARTYVDGLFAGTPT